MPKNIDPDPSFFAKLRTFFLPKKKKHRHKTDLKLKASLAELIDEHAENGESIASDERELLGNVLDLRELTAADVMVQRVDIVAVPQNISEEELLKAFVKSRFDRLPVYRENLDEILGVIQIHDLFSWKVSGKPFDIKTLIRDVMFISPTMKTLDLLFQMRERGIRMAVVVDEYGGVDGIVAFSDLVEEIIGDIQDAHEHEPPQHIRKADGSIVVDGRVDLDILEEHYDLDLIIEDLEDEIETIGGLVSSLAGYVPVRGEVVKHPDQKIEFEVIDADPRRVKRLVIRMIPS